jgi:ribosomal protein S18 acetylase RimI-like enzyme
LAEIEIVDVFDDRASAFLRAGEREALSTLYGFRVVWHGQTHEFAALDGERVAGALRARIAASLAHIEALSVEPARRRSGIGRALLEKLREIALYYNCHKVTAEVPHGSAAQAFLEACGYKVEAVLPQHTFKLDVAVMRKFLL